MLAVFKNSRSAHRTMVPIALAPLLLTAVTGILFSLLEAREIEADWLLALHIGHFGPPRSRALLFGDPGGLCAGLSRLWAQPLVQNPPQG